jgi:DNA-binding beta-propeller fold protein YncE
MSVSDRSRLSIASLSRAVALATALGVAAAAAHGATISRLPAEAGGSAPADSVAAADRAVGPTAQAGPVTPAQAAPPAAPPRRAPPAFAAYDAASEPFLSDPHDLTIGPDGRLYVADKLAGRIAILDPESLELVGEFGGGALPGVRDISFTPDGLAAVAVSGLGQVLVFDLAEDPPRLVRALPAPGTEGALVHSNGRIYASVGAACAVAAYQGAEVVAVVGVPCGAHDIAEGLDGSLWVPDLRGGRVLRFSPDLSPLGWVGGPEAGLIGPRYLAVDPAGRLAVADEDGHRIVLIDPSIGPHGAVVGVLGDGAPGVGPGKFDSPEGAASDGARYWFADSDNNRVVRYAIVVN